MLIDSWTLVASHERPVIFSLTQSSAPAPMSQLIHSNFSQSTATDCLRRNADLATVLHRRASKASCRVTASQESKLRCRNYRTIDALIDWILRSLKINVSVGHRDQQRAAHCRHNHTPAISIAHKWQTKSSAILFTALAICLDLDEKCVRGSGVEIAMPYINIEPIDQEFQFSRNENWSIVAGRTSTSFKTFSSIASNAMPFRHSKRAMPVLMLRWVHIEFECDDRVRPRPTYYRFDTFSPLINHIIIFRDFLFVFSWNRNFIVGSDTANKQPAQLQLSVFIGTKHTGLMQHTHKHPNAAIQL